MRDQVLTSRAKRKQEEVAAERARFELIRDRIVFGFQLALAVVITVAGMTVLALNPELIPMALLGGGGVWGLLLRRR